MYLTLKHPTSYYAYLLSLLSLLGCQGSGDSKKVPIDIDKIEETEELPEQSENATGSETFSLNSLAGTWTTLCRESAENSAPYRASGGGQMKRFLKFDGDTFALTILGSTDLACATDMATVLVEISGTAKLGAPASAKDQLGQPMGHEIDFSYADITVTPVSVAAVETLNGFSYCKKSDWTLGTRTILNAQECPSLLLDLGLVPHNVIALVEQELILGSYYESDTVGSTPSDRPTKWSWNEELTHTEASIPTSEDPSPKPDEESTDDETQTIATAGLTIQQLFSKIIPSDKQYKFSSYPGKMTYNIDGVDKGQTDDARLALSIYDRIIDDEWEQAWEARSYGIGVSSSLPEYNAESRLRGLSLRSR
jgi:hypothetical protein